MSNNNISLTHIFCDLMNDKQESIKNAFVCDIQKCTFSPCIENERARERVENATNTLIWVLFSVETAIKPHHLEQQLTINAHIHKKSSFLKNLLSEYRV